MPSPIGHALAGLAVAWAADLIPGDRAWRFGPQRGSWYQHAGHGLTLACLLLAAGPDLDLLLSRFHRSVTHSITAVVLVGIVAAVAALRARKPIARVTLMCAGAWATHLLLDWLAVDRAFAPYGIQLLWPFSDAWFISDWDLFRGTERHDIFRPSAVRQNLIALAQELLLLGPIVLTIWLVRVKALARLPAKLSRSDHPPQ
jgi:hypothetical protein